MPIAPDPHGHAPAREGTHATGAPSGGSHRTGNHHARSVEEHRTAVMELLAPLRAAGRTEQVALREALGRGLAHEVTAPVSLPPFANSQMDGFAVNSAALPYGGAELRVAAPVPAGAMPAPLQRAQPPRS